jgi:hypothetical protein
LVTVIVKVTGAPAAALLGPVTAIPRPAAAV